MVFDVLTQQLQEQKMRHPSIFIREHVIPEGLTVIQAAGILGVGRPALSTFLNGKAALSLDMALRLEKSFGANAQELLNMQIEYEKHRAGNSSRERPPKSFVPPFLQPKAKDIEKWATSGINARFRLAVFLRTLIRSTGNGVTFSNFPGDDEAERRGWDGKLHATESTPWIPEGSSCWEFSTESDPLSKAKKDYESRTKNVDQEERQKTTFVFVTPNGWTGQNRENWLKECRSSKHWKDVRGYDSNDLVQWLEQSIPGQTWFANETDSESLGTRTLEAYWDEWTANWPEDRIPNLFQSSVHEYKKKISESLYAETKRPVSISADSSSEALAFLHCLFKSGSELLPGSYDNVVVFTEKGTLKKVATKYSNFIAVIIDSEIEKELDSFRNNIPAIVIHPKTARGVKSDVELRPLRYSSFEKAMSEAGYNASEIEQLSRESGRSLTILRRRISKLPNVRTPEWAKNLETASDIIPFFFAGAWRTNNEADRLVMKILANVKDYEQVEGIFIKLRYINESPVWTTETAKGLVSKIDVLHAVAPYITESELIRFFNLARLILSGSYNGIESNEQGIEVEKLSERVHEISKELRGNILDTLVLMAVYRESVFSVDIKPKLEAKLNRLVKDLLRDLTVFKRNSCSYDLRYYAEACPKLFIESIERDIASDYSVCRNESNRDSTGYFDNSFMTNLMAALELLAWSTEHLPYVVDILAKLSSTEDKHGVNEITYSSLNKILDNILPQTSASASDRRLILERVITQNCEVGWRLCMSVLDPYPRFVTDNFKPMYLDLGQRHDQRVLKSDVYSVIDYCVKNIEEVFELDKDKINELLSIVQFHSGPTHSKVWEVIKQWCKKAISSEKAWVKSKIPEIAFTRAALKNATNLGLDESHFSQAKELYEELKVTDTVLEHRWLFEKMWIERTTADESTYSYDQDHEENVKQRRILAINKIYQEQGINGITELLFSERSAWIVGRVIAGSEISKTEIVSFVKNLVQEDHRSEGNSLNGDLLKALISSITCDRIFLYSLLENLPQSKHLEILLISPFDEYTWVKVRELPQTDQSEYWKNVDPLSPKLSVDQLGTAVTNLLKANRPHIALSLSEYDIENISSELLFQILNDIDQIDQGSYDNSKVDDWLIQRIIKLLSLRKDMSEHLLASLELKFIEFLDNEARKPLNTEILIESEPTYFAQLIAYAYERVNGNVDFKTESESNIRRRAVKARKMLDRLKRIPGRDENGTINGERMLRWIKEVRRLCQARSLENFCDRTIGRMFAKAIQSDISNWPTEPILGVLEEVLTEDMSKGLVSSLYLYSYNKPASTYGGEHDRKEARWHSEKAGFLRITHQKVAIIHDRVAKYLNETAGDEVEKEKLDERLRA